MAAYDTSRPFAASSTNSRIGGFASTMINAVISWNDARVTRNQLGTLTNRELDDIGLVRGDIDDVSTRR